MLKVILIVLMMLHGFIHLIGFTKAFNLAPVTQLTQVVSKPNGILWMLATLLFVSAALLIFLRKDAWWILAVMAVFVSQYLIITTWQDAKWGTVANVFILIATLLQFKYPFR
ncbi:MAG: hypothetical protein IPP15_22820 [Saprospiraceae bacterium]|uniref:Uncharacterized protein n=1 Tax=Candidatus Opimibacter skivensis TaxID=2982028 RepID=A0A9D7SXN9_9BACT|nr:hypothetical protein [Candidatus Opimibacter skivensis]